MLIELAAHLRQERDWGQAFFRGGRLLARSCLSEYDSHKQERACSQKGEGVIRSVLVHWADIGCAIYPVHL